jgi:hypothetical protein
MRGTNIAYCPSPFTSRNLSDFCFIKNVSLDSKSYISSGLMGSQAHFYMLSHNIHNLVTALYSANVYAIAFSMVLEFGAL